MTRIAELPSGAILHQVTHDDAVKSNIYCETPYCSADGRTFVYQRHGDPNDTAYMLVEFGSWKRWEALRGYAKPGISHRGQLYVRRPASNGGEELMRLNLDDGATTCIHELPEPIAPRSRPAISDDERYMAYCVALSYEPQRFGIRLIDLHSGCDELVHEDPHIWNAHLQFEPGARRLLVQHNRGSRFSPEGERLQKCGPEGKTVFLLSVPGGEVTRMKAGPPHTPDTTGHEAWVPGSGGVVFTTAPSDDVNADTGNLFRVRPGEAPAHAVRGGLYNHIATSRCGGYVALDTLRTGERLYVGSLSTGRVTDIGPTGTDQRYGQQETHPHPWLSSDLRWMVFNSTRTGCTQIYAAELPPGVVEW